MIAKFVFLLVLIHTSCAFILSSRSHRVVQASRDVDSDCLARAEVGNCTFYRCFDDRLTCGTDWYMRRYGEYYCRKMVTNSARFSPAGQTFLNNARLCMTNSLRQNYTQDSINCHDLEHAAVAAIQPCFTSNGFCDLIRTDAHELARLYEFTDLFSVGSNKVWRAIARIGLECGTQFLSQLTSSARQSFWDNISSVFDK